MSKLKPIYRFLTPSAMVHQFHELNCRNMGGLTRVYIPAPPSATFGTPSLMFDKQTFESRRDKNSYDCVVI